MTADRNCIIPAGVLYTSEPQDLTAADVVLVITASGGDAAGYADYATPGQVSYSAHV